MESLFVVPSVFSTLTSGLQKIHLDSVLSPWRAHVDEGKNEEEVSPVVMELLQEVVSEHHFQLPDEFTVFAPTNGVRSRYLFRELI